MAEESKSPKKVPISEEDAAVLLHRYSPETILALLQEVWQNTGIKVDWNALVKNTNTGITNAREYQTLWRHVAYGHTLCDEMEGAENPLDDDSDMEIEREPFPHISREASAEAAACVKVLMASGCQNDPDVPSNSTIEAPLIISIPNIKASAPPGSSLHENGVQSMNITIPVFVQKQPLTSGTSTGEKRPISEQPTGVNLPPRRKRRGWSTEEDMKLTAAIQKYGEQNWANIASGDFKNDRKPSELSQRWTSLKKKQGNSNVVSNSQPSETQLAAAHRAMSLALDMPMGDHLKSASHVGNVGTKLPHHQPKKEDSTTSPQKHHQLGAAAARPSSVKASPPPPTPVGPDPMIKAAALAAGARIATSAHAASLLEATRSQNVVRIKTGGGGGGGPVIKSSATSITNQLPTNVHFIRDGLAKAPISAHTAAKPNVTRSSAPVKSADGPVKPIAQSDRGVDGGLSVGAPTEQKDQSAKSGNASEKS